MTERAAHLMDAVLPWVPVRQWVLTVPYRLRYQMAWNHGLSRAVLRVHSRVLLDLYAGGARARGFERGQTGMVTAVQRAGSGLNVNLHFHTLVLDGVPVPEPTASTVPLAAGPDGTGVKTASPRAGSWAALMHRACRSPEPARSIWEEAADVYCSNGLLGRPVSASGRLSCGDGHQAR